MRNLSERGGPGKLRAYWEKIVHRVVERLGEGPVYKIQPERGSKSMRVLHRNLLLPVNDLPLEEELLVAEKIRPSRPKLPSNSIDQMGTDSSDEEQEYTYPYNLRSRIPCYRLVNPQRPQPAIPQVPEQRELVNLSQNSQNQPKLRATAQEFCPPQKQETEMEPITVEQGPEPVEREQGPEPVEREPDRREGMDEENTVEGNGVRRSQRRTKPVTRLTYDVLGQPSYHHCSANVNPFLISQPMPETLSFPTFPYSIYPQLYYPNVYNLVQ